MFFKKMELIFLCYLILFSLQGCDVIEVFITEGLSDKGRLADCEGLEFDVVIEQGRETERTKGKIINGALSFKLTHTIIIELEREVSLTLLVTGDTKNNTCEFVKGSVYKTNNFKLKPLNKDMKIYEIELGKFYRYK